MLGTNGFNCFIRGLLSDDSAINEIYNYYFKRIVFHLGNSYGVALAEDIAQEFFIKLLQNESKEYIEYPTSWVYKCCGNIAKRKIAHESKYMELNEVNISENDYSEEFRYVDLYCAIKALNEVSQKIIFLYHWEGYNLIEVAEMLGLPYATIKQNHHRALGKLRKILI